MYVNIEMNDKNNNGMPHQLKIFKEENLGEPPTENLTNGATQKVEGRAGWERVAKRLSIWPFKRVSMLNFWGLLFVVLFLEEIFTT